MMVDVTHQSEEEYSPMLYRCRSALTEIALTAFVLGFAACACVVMMVGSLAGVVGDEWLFACGVYMLVSFCLFHFSEFIVASEYRPRDASPNAFMIFHSTAFILASVLAWLEFVVGGWILGLGYHPKPSFWSVTLAAVVACCFYAVRLTAMVQSGSNFSLMIETSRRTDHVLITTGLYSRLRHPAYFGWFWFAICSQLIILNPICLVLWTLASWMFFRDRIAAEEDILASRDFFGDEYTRYKSRSITGIPFLS